VEKEMTRNIKIFSVAILFALLCSNLCLSQWVWQNPSPYDGMNLNSVYFVNANTGFGAGWGIMRTTNGGINWSYQLESLQFYDVYFINANTGAAVGNNSKIYHTTNGGVNWVAQSNGHTGESLYEVLFINANTGFASGSKNKIYRTTDGGDTWELKTDTLYSANNSLHGLCFIDANTGIAVGSNNTRILRTTNTGQSWDSIGVGISNKILYGVSFANANTGVAVGSSRLIVRTTNGGLNWTTVNVATDYVYLNNVEFFDSLNVVAVGSTGLIMRSTNAGLNWTTITSGTTVTLNVISTPDANTGIAAVGTTVIRSTNAGLNWSMVHQGGTSVSSDILERICYINANTGTIVGDGGTILRTTNGGANWVAQTSPTTGYNFSDVCFIDVNTGFAVGSDEYKKKSGTSKSGGMFVKTTNGGTNWTITYPGYWIYGVSFVDANTGWISGSSPSGTGGVYKTTNGGSNWTQQLDSLVGYVHFFDVNTGLAAGYSGIYRTLNGGTNWSKCSNYSAWNFSFINTNTGWARGSNNYVYHTTDNGKNWITQTTGHMEASWDISFADSLHGVVSYMNGRYARTTDGGNTWAIETTGTQGNATIYGICYNSTGVTAACDYGIILHNSFVSIPSAPTLISPTNGATNQSNTPKMKWSSISNATSYRLQISTDSAFSSTTLDSTGVTIDSITVPSGKLTNGIKYYWRVNATNTAGTSSWSTIFNFTVSATGTNTVSSELPKEYMLYNNYPNPFNPTTKIKFDIPKNGLTKIAIYDVLGREVKTLVNENLTAGTYEIQWNATSYASGIYFYKMISNGYTSIKKMALIK
jgi:photosystem II stability/assembly factor-like uncharacterized protein